MTHGEHAVYLLLTLLAAGFSVPGWLLPLRDGVARFTWRYLACGAFAGAMIWAAAARHSSWAWRVPEALVALWMIHRTSHWWNRTEQVRKFVRAVEDHKRRGGVWS